MEYIKLGPRCSTSVLPKLVFNYIELPSTHWSMDEKTAEWLVFGFIRNVQHLLNSNIICSNIPVDIYGLCMFFYYNNKHYSYDNNSVCIDIWHCWHNRDAKIQMMETQLKHLCVSLHKHEFIQCMRLLSIIVDNLIRRPINIYEDSNRNGSKYRTLNLNNKKLKNHLFKHGKHVINLLNIIGFEQHGNYLKLQDKENPILFQALKQKIVNWPPPKDIPITIKRDTKIYSSVDVIKVAANTELYSQSYSSDLSIIAQCRKVRQQTYKLKYPTELMGEKLRQKKYGIKQKEYVFIIIRIEFPSKYVLEGLFHPNEPIYKLFEYVESFLDLDANINYKLVLPPYQVLQNWKDTKQTFKTVGGMIPACRLRFMLDTKLNENDSYYGKYIKDEFIEKYFTKEITSLKSLKSLKSFQSLNLNNDKSENKNNNNNNLDGLSTKEKIKRFKQKRKKEALKRKLQKLEKLRQ